MSRDEIEALLAQAQVVDVESAKKGTPPTGGPPTKAEPLKKLRELLKKKPSNPSQEDAASSKDVAKVWLGRGKRRQPEL
ncbi:MAG TPA: hypothetical protein VFB38_15205 [Chthonomonadaceae bacterium]|nr:hypothetical protein [Chthonomonadaceae bacterium]